MDEKNTRNRERKTTEFDIDAALARIDRMKLMGSMERFLSDEQTDPALRGIQSAILSRRDLSPEEPSEASSSFVWADDVSEEDMLFFEEAVASLPLSEIGRLSFFSEAAQMGVIDTSRGPRPFFIRNMLNYAGEYPDELGLREGVMLSFDFGKDDVPCRVEIHRSSDIPTRTLSEETVADMMRFRDEQRERELRQSILECQAAVNEMKIFLSKDQLTDEDLLLIDDYESGRKASPSVLGLLYEQIHGAPPSGDTVALIADMEEHGVSSVEAARLWTAEKHSNSALLREHLGLSEKK
jgi:hypothetical protein